MALLDVLFGLIVVVFWVGCYLRVIGRIIVAVNFAFLSTMFPVVGVALTSRIDSNINIAAVTDK